LHTNTDEDTQHRPNKIKCLLAERSVDTQHVVKIRQHCTHTAQHTHDPSKCGVDERHATRPDNEREKAEKENAKRT
jgi:hypothetical protein